MRHELGGNEVSLKGGAGEGKAGLGEAAKRARSEFERVGLEWI